MKKLAQLMTISAAPAFIILKFRYATGDPYLDAGTGSIIIQALIGGLVAGLVALKIFWGRISTSFKSIFSRDKKREKS